LFDDIVKHTDTRSTFESSLKRLEKIVEDLERGNVPLEAAMQMYEEGIELSRACIEKLTQAELKLKKLTKKIDGSYDLTDLDADKL
jgi:exodeoxyribonuclease VII small subunit